MTLMRRVAQRVLADQAGLNMYVYMGTGLEGGQLATLRTAEFIRIDALRFVADLPDPQRQQPVRVGSRLDGSGGFCNGVHGALRMGHPPLWSGCGRRSGFSSDSAERLLKFLHALFDESLAF